MNILRQFLFSTKVLQQRVPEVQHHELSPSHVPTLTLLSLGHCATHFSHFHTFSSLCSLVFFTLLTFDCTFANAELVFLIAVWRIVKY